MSVDQGGVPLGSVSQRSLDPLFQLLLSSSVGLHEYIARSEDHGMPAPEEVLTHHLLFGLVEASPAIRVITFTRWEENRTTGADWEFWFEGSRHWFGTLVQAKKLKDGSRPYDFGYTPRNSPKTRQIDRLLAASEERRLPAYYALYNGPRLGGVSDWQCGVLDAQLPALGCAVIPAATALGLLASGATGLAEVRRYLHPLPCLLCPEDCKETSLWPRMRPRVAEHWGLSSDMIESDLASRAALGAVQLMQRWPPFARFPLAQTVDSVGRGLRRDLPEYARAALGDSFADGAAVAEEFGLGDLAPDYLVVVSQSDELQ